MANISKLFRFLKLLRSMINMARDPNPKYVFDISDSTNRLNMYGLSKDVMLTNDEVQRSIREMWLLPKIDLAQFRVKPDGTFAREYARHMDEHNYDPEFWRRSEISNDITYITVRMRQTHDFWHVMTGFDNSKIGEIGLQAFVLAQTGLPIAMLLVSGALIRASFVDTRTIPALMDAIAKGWIMGKNARPIFPIKWEEVWDRPLESIQEEYKITPLQRMKLVA